MANILEGPVHFYFNSTDCQLPGNKWIERRRKEERQQRTTEKLERQRDGNEMAVEEEGEKNCD